MLGIGRITAMKDGGVVQSIQYQTPLEVASAPRMAEFGFSSGLPSGTDVVLAFIGGDRSSAVVIASNHQGFLANTPILRCTGDIVDNCETNTRTLKELRDAHNDHDHVVKNAQSGNDNIRSQKTEDQVT